MIGASEQGVYLLRVHEDASAASLPWWIMSDYTADIDGWLVLSAQPLPLLRVRAKHIADNAH